MGYLIAAVLAAAAAPPFLSVRTARNGDRQVEVGMKASAAASCCLFPINEGDALVVDLRSNETEPAPPDPNCDHPFGPRPQYCFERQGGLAHKQREGVFTVRVPRGRALKVLTWEEEFTLAPRGTVTRRKSRRPPLPPPAMD